MNNSLPENRKNGGFGVEGMGKLRKYIRENVKNQYAF